MKFERLDRQQKKDFQSLLREGVQNATIIAQRVFPQLYSAMPRNAEIEAEELLEESERTMSTATEPLTAAALAKLSDDQIKTTATRFNLSLRGRFSKPRLIERILAAQASPNGNGAAPSGNGSLKVHEPGPADELERLEQEDAAANDPEVIEETTEATATATTTKDKDVAVELIRGERRDQLQAAITRLVERFHPHLLTADFTLFWRYGWKREADTNRIKFAEVKKSNETHRELNAGDFLLYLNYDLFKEIKAGQRDRIIDDELEKCKADLDKDGNQKRNSAGNLLWRLRKFTGVNAAVIARHGLLTQEECELAAAFESKTQKPLFEFD